MSKMTPQEVEVGRLIASLLDQLKGAMVEPDGWHYAIYLGRKDDPTNSYLLGDLEQGDLLARLAILERDAGKLGVLTRHGVTSEQSTPGAGVQ